jgi:tetratricopeptide (TPR) repeat protein
LALLGVVPPDPAHIMPARQQKRNWQSRLAFPGNPDLAGAKAITRPQFALIGLAAVVVVGLIAFAVFGMQNQLRKRYVRPIIIMPSSTAVLAQAATATMVKKADGTPLPLEAMLKQTYTPTPFYVNTPHSVSEAYRIGQRALQVGEWDRAITYFKQASELEPDAADIYYYLGEAYRQQGQLGKAQQVYTDGIQKNGEFAPLYVGRARALLAENPKSMEAVERDLQEAIQKDPSFGEAYLTMAEMHIQAGRAAQALAILDEAESLLPDSPMVYLYQAEAYMAADEPAKALESARAANQRDITLLLAYRMMGEALQAQGNMKSSLDPLNTYLRYSPADAQALFLLANAQFAGGDKTGARSTLDQALRLDNDQAAGLMLRGRLLLDEKKASDALDDFRAALRLDTESFEASLGVAKALLDLKYPGDAYAQIEKSKSLALSDRQKAEWLFWRAQSLDVLGEKEVALRDYQALLDLPKGTADEAWIAFSQKRIDTMITRTPTQKPRTATPTITLTHTRQPTRTFTATHTRQPTRTLTPTATPIPTRTKTPVKP